LNDSETGSHIWAERYDRELADIFDLQDELTEAICTVVNAELAGSERVLARKKSPSDLDAWDYFQRGMGHLYKMSENEIAEARRLFEIAAERAPSFPSPMPRLAMSPPSRPCRATPATGTRPWMRDCATPNAR
jgi:hypothetical protein